MRPNPASSFTRFFAAPTRPLAAAALTCALLAAPCPTLAQDCDAPTWSTAFTSGRFDNTPHCLLSRGPDLIAGGRFEEAGGLPIPGVARWDGQAWQPMGEGLPWRVRVLIDFDSGNGPLLYACGSLIDGNNDGGARIARWNGQSWDPIAGGPDGGIRAAAVLDDGSGPALFCVGSFTELAGVPAAGAARFDGHTWTPLGSGLTGYANAAAIFDDGAGPALFVGGKFTAAGGTPASGLAKWDGIEWSSVGGGVAGSPAEVLTIVAHTEGGQNRLYVGGNFKTVGDGTPSLYAATWDGAQWIPLTGMLYQVADFAEVEEGGARLLYAAAQHGGVDAHIFVLSETQWTEVGINFIAESRALISHPFNGAPALHIAVEDSVYVLRNGDWLALGSGTARGGVSAITEFDRGNGPEVIVSGGFDQAGGIKVTHGEAVWNGVEWRPLFEQGGVGGASGFEAFDDGSGTALYAAMSGYLARVYRLGDGEWLPVGHRLGNPVTDLQVFDDGSEPALFACGGWEEFEDGSNGVARLQNGEWVPVGAGVSGEDWPYALAVYNDGTGAALYIAGGFAQSDGVPLNGFAKWDGTKWRPQGKAFRVHDPFYDVVFNLVVFNDGSGPALYAGGHFLRAGGEPANNIARWDGKAWSALGQGVDGSVWSMATFDDGTGSALYVSGTFAVAGGAPAAGLAKWNAAGWQPIDLAPAYAHALAMSPSSFNGGSLFLGGNFDAADDTSSGNFAQLIGCYPCFADFDHDNAVTLFDFLAFLNAFNAADPAADCDHSASFDLFDFLCFTNSFNQGC